MEISYHLNLADIIAFNINHLMTNVKAVSKMRRNRILMSVIYCFLGLIIFFVNQNLWPISLFFVSIGILWMKYYLEICKIRVMNQLRKAYKGVDFADGRYEYKLHLFPWGIEASNVSYNGKIFYKEIIDLQSTDAHLFLYLEAKSAVIIPRDSLNPGEMWDEVKLKIRQWYDVAKNEK